MPPVRPGTRRVVVGRPSRELLPRLCAFKAVTAVSVG